jgi:hypothetical protein
MLKNSHVLLLISYHIAGYVSILLIALLASFLARKALELLSGARYLLLQVAQVLQALRYECFLFGRVGGAIAGCVSRE